MNCFIDYIGLRHCSQNEPESGFYINDMAGISLRRMDNISNSEKNTFVGVWDSIQKRAAIEIEARILNKFTNSYRIGKSLDNSTFGYFTDDVTNLPLEPKLKGTYLYAYPNTWTKINITTVELYASQAYDGAKFYVYDLNSGTKLKEINVDLSIGYNKFTVGFSDFNRANYYVRLFLCYDANIVSLRKSTANYLQYDFNSVTAVASQDGEVTGSPHYSNFTSNQGSGLSVSYDLECSLEAFICPKKQLFKYAWCKLLAAEIYNETLNSDRTNYFTTLDRDQAQSEYTRNMSDFNMSITDVLDNINAPMDEICFECNTITKAVHLRP